MQREILNQKKENAGFMFRRKGLMLIASILMLGLFTGCGYTEEEKAQMQEYESQASENAIQYISEKYGFKANVLETSCETVDSSGVPDFSPSATGDVLIRMEHNGDEFLVMISGEEPTTDGIDNYQLEQVQRAIEEQMHAITGFSVQEVLVVYGSYYETRMDLKDSGLVRTYYDGSNLSEVLSEENCQIVFSFVDVDLSEVSAGAVKETFGDGELLLVSYRSEEDFEDAGRRCYNLGGAPLAYDVEDKALYIREYRVIGGNDEEYVVYDLREQDGIYYIPQDRDAQVILTKTELDDVSNWNGRGFLDARQVLDTAYAITSETNAIYFFVPVELLEDIGSADSEGMIAYQYEGDDGTRYKHTVTDLSDDGRYLVGTIYTQNYPELKISVLQDCE